VTDTRELNKSYIGVRIDILDVIPARARKFLDVGCSVGALGAELVAVNPEAEVYGIELDPDMARLAMEKLHKVYVANMDDFSLAAEFAPETFDCVVLADILEHLKNPWQVVAEAAEITAAEGFVIACIPNVRHLDTVLNLVFRGVWPYRDRGIHDRTHLRFFTRKNIVELFSVEGIEIEAINTNYRLLERPSRINRWAKYFALPGLKHFLAFQYIIVARKQ
jgi:2-polyprenyl-3-methyl-5-hydroxy-6-metoxy-1,4-benzoquinol methylase